MAPQKILAIKGLRGFVLFEGICVNLLKKGKLVIKIFFQIMFEWNSKKLFKNGVSLSKS